MLFLVRDGMRSRDWLKQGIYPFPIIIVCIKRKKTKEKEASEIETFGSEVVLLII